VAAEGTIIYVGNDIQIDLGDKKIVKNGEDVMSITAITINGDENIEIIPRAPEEEEEEPSGSGGAGTGDGTGEGTGEGDGTGEGGAGGSTDGSGGTGNPNVDAPKIEDIIITLKDVLIGSTNIVSYYDIVNAEEDDVFMLKVTNLDTGRTLDMEPVRVVADYPVDVGMITPKTKYLFTIYNPETGDKYFQKIFETKDFGVTLERAYATSDAIAYTVTFGEDTEINEAKVKLYKYNEETGENELVVTREYPETSDDDSVIEKVRTIRPNKDGNLEGVHTVVFEDLKSNSIYTAVLEDIKIESTNFVDLYNVSLTSLTLKKRPKFELMKPVTNVGNNSSFTISVGNVEDEDLAITGYTYEIYHKADYNKYINGEIKEINTVIKPSVTKKTADPYEVGIGEKGNKDNLLENGVDYVCRVILEYFDNEKYMEYTIDQTIDLYIGDKPYINVVRDDSEGARSNEKISADIFLTDNSCKIPMSGRNENCIGDSKVKVLVRKVTSGGEIDLSVPPVYEKEVVFKVDGNDIKYHLEVSGLDESTTYQIDVMAIYKDEPEKGHQMIEHDPAGDDKRITTKTLASFITDWKAKEWVTDHIVNIQTQFLPAADFSGGDLDMTPEETADKIKKVIIELYAGDYNDDLSLAGYPIDTAIIIDSEEFDIKENFYDKGYVITTDETFGIEDVSALKALDPSEECKLDSEKCKLYSEYTVAVYAFYDEEGTEPNRVKLGENYYESYTINPLLMQENIVDPLLDPVEIFFDTKDNEYASWFPALMELRREDAVIGYTVAGRVDADTLRDIGYKLKTLTINVFNKDKEPVSFYVKDGDGLKAVPEYTYELADNWDGFISDLIYLDHGIENDSSEEKPFMRRGGEYYIGYVILYDIVNEDGVVVKEDIKYPSLETTEEMPFNQGYYKLKTVTKVTPRYKDYIAYSDEDSITYRYDIKDVDNSIYKENGKYGLYYMVQDKAGTVKVTEGKIDIDDPTETSYKTFAGYATIEGLSKDDVYKLYYKEVSLGDNVIITEGYPGRIFDGYYSEEEYKDDFKFELVTDDEKDNKVYIKMLASEEILRRVISYKATFIDKKANDYTIETSMLSSCPGDEELPVEGEESEEVTPVVKRCLSVDYKTLELEGMKSKGEENNYITVSVDAYFDTGIVGFEVPSYGDKYKYMVFQEHNTEAEYGNYISYFYDAEKKSGKLKKWEEKIEKNYYNYKIDDAKTSLIVRKELTDKASTFGITWSHSYLGIRENSIDAIINPKMIAISKMASEKDYFKFSSITPKIKVEKVGSIINGAVYDLTLSGADLNDFVYEKDGYYLYIDTYRTVQNAEGQNVPVPARDRLKYPIKLDENGKPKTIRVTIDLLPNGRNYHMTVSANLYKDGLPDFVQLFDADNMLDTVVKNYEFSPLGYANINSVNGASPYKFKFAANLEKQYGSRDLILEHSINEYIIDYNFDYAYAVYDYSVNCTPSMIEEGTCEAEPVARGKIERDKLTTKIEDVSDISDDVLDPDFEFGKTYYAFIYAIYEVWDEGKVKTSYLGLNDYYRSFVAEDKLDTDISDGINKLLIQPKISVLREAKIIEGNLDEGIMDVYTIEASVTIHDPHRTILGGKYHVKLYKGDQLLDCTTGCMMQEMDEEGNWKDVLDYLNYSLDASKGHNMIRFVGLEKDTKYKIYFEAGNYMNNIGLSEEEKNKPVPKEHYVYTLNDFGVALGEIRYRVEKDNVIVSYVGGSSFKKIDKIDYKVQLNENASSVAPYIGEYILNQEGSKEFVPDEETGYYKFIIDDGLHTLGLDYLITTSYSMLDGVDEEGKPKYKLIHSFTDTDLYQTTNKNN